MGPLAGYFESRSFHEPLTRMQSIILFWLIYDNIVISFICNLGAGWLCMIMRRFSNILSLTISNSLSFLPTLESKIINFRIVGKQRAFLYAGKFPTLTTLSLFPFKVKDKEKELKIQIPRIHQQNRNSTFFSFVIMNVLKAT